MKKPFRIRDVFNYDYGFFKNVEHPCWENIFETDVLDDEILLNRGMRFISPLVEHFVKRGKLSPEDTARIANKVYSKYKIQFEHFVLASQLKYAPIENYDSYETYTEKHDTTGTKTGNETNTTTDTSTRSGTNNVTASGSVRESGSEGGNEKTIFDTADKETRALSTESTNSEVLNGTVTNLETRDTASTQTRGGSDTNTTSGKDITAQSETHEGTVSNAENLNNTVSTTNTGTTTTKNTPDTEETVRVTNDSNDNLTTNNTTVTKETGEENEVHTENAYGFGSGERGAPSNTSTNHKDFGANGRLTTVADTKNENHKLTGGTTTNTSKSGTDTTRQENDLTETASTTGTNTNTTTNNLTDNLNNTITYGKTDTTTYNSTTTTADTGTVNNKTKTDNTNTATGRETQSGSVTNAKTGQETLERALTHETNSNTSNTEKTTSEETGKNTQNGTRELSEGTSEKGTITHELRRHGNIGVTTSQQMLESELKLWQWNLADEIVKHTLSVIALDVYTVEEDEDDEV